MLRLRHVQTDAKAASNLCPYGWPFVYNRERKLAGEAPEWPHPATTLAVTQCMVARAAHYV